MAHDEHELPSVLVVEDEHELAELYEKWIDGRYRVQTANSGEEALEIIDESIDVVMLDRRIPGLSGGEVLDLIREEGLHCRVVIVSAVEPDFDVISMGFDDYLKKPVSKEQFIGAIERMRTRAKYDEQTQLLYQLISKQATLEAEKTDKQLAANDQYANLLSQITDLRADVDMVLDEFDAEDYEAAYHDI